MDFLHAFGRDVLQIILPSLAGVIGTMLVALINRALKKQGIELTAAQADWLKQRAKDAIQAAEEQARRQPMNGQAKHALARDLLAASAPEEQVDDRALAIDAALPEVRADLSANRSITPADRSQFR